MTMADQLLWAEDLESHREPALYYLGDEEGADGPHLICDWNGSPTDLNELDIDVLSMFRESELSEMNFKNSAQLGHDQISSDNDTTNSYPNPTTVFAKSIPNSNSNFVLGGDDRMRIDLLTVPPTATGLLKRIIRTARANKLATTKLQQMPPIQESCESRPIATKGISKQTISKKTARASTGGLAGRLKEHNQCPLKSLNELADKSRIANGTLEHPVVVD